jgi:hypothetical protein
MELQPLSRSSYHDWRLVGIDLPPDAVRLRLRNDDDRAAIELEAVVFFIATDLMKGNIVLELSSVSISPETVSWVVDDLISFDSAYFTRTEYEHFRSSPDILGKTYVVVTCSYGVRLGAICGSVRETFDPDLAGNGDRA